LTKVQLKSLKDFEEGSSKGWDSQRC